MKKTTKQAIGIGAFIILILVVILGSMRMAQQAEEQEQAKQKVEKEQKEKEQKEAEKLASEYIDSYAETLQEDIRDVGLLDLKVTYAACTRDYFDEYWILEIMDKMHIAHIIHWTTIVTQLTVFMNAKQKMVISSHLSNY